MNGIIADAISTGSHGTNYRTHQQVVNAHLWNITFRNVKNAVFWNVTEMKLKYAT
jgi:hypothetical protein